MVSSVELRLDLDDESIVIPAEVEETCASPHTGRPVRTLRTAVRFSAETTERVKALLEPGQIVDADGRAWEARLESESYVDEDGPHYLNIRWEEHESLAATTLEFLGLVVEPTRYSERFDDGSIIITFQATMSTEDSERLRSARWDADDPAGRYWPVIRRGVSDTALQMRLGRVLWCPREDHAVDFQVTLVQDAYDADESSDHLASAFSGEPVVGNLKRQVASLTAQMTELLRRLDDGEQLGPEAVAEIRAAGERGPRQLEYTFFEVRSLASWWTSDS